jgi:hypothetical protein
MNKIIDELIKKIQKEYDNTKYPDKKTPHDKLECQICGGRYTRHKRSIHYKSAKHTKGVAKYHNSINNII